VIKIPIRHTNTNWFISATDLLIGIQWNGWILLIKRVNIVDIVVPIKMVVLNPK
jgi:hypothetical protein